MNKILVLTPRFPYPVIGGDRLRIYHICKELSKTYDLTLLSLCESKEELDMAIPNDGVFKQVERILLPKWRSYLNCILSLPTSKPLQVAYYSSKNFKIKLSELIHSHDLALSHLIRTGHYLTGNKIPKVLEMTDAISMNYERVGAIAKSSGFKNIVYSIEQKRLKAFEQTIAQNFNTSVFVSQVDKDYLFPMGHSIRDNVLVCSNGVSFDELPLNYFPDGKTIIFIGNMTTVQNLDAAFWFATNVMPELIKHGDFSFKVIGRIKEHQKEEFNKLSNTIATGGVESICEATKGAFVGVCPMRLGAGVQNKVLEYMAMGIPTITSSIGLEGIEATIDKELLVADKVSEYVNKILGLSKQKDMASSIGFSGYEYVKKAHTWEGKLAPLLNNINSLINKKL